MKSAQFLIQFGIFLFNFTLVKSDSDVRTLLKNQIEKATCEARCVDIHEQETMTECLELCRQSLNNPDSPVCRVSFLCPLCRRACGLEYPETRFSLFKRKGNCHICHVVFLITATDEGGMRHLVTVTEHHRMPLSQLSRGYTALSVMAVGETGIKDSIEISLPRNREN